MIISRCTLPEPLTDINLGKDYIKVHTILNPRSLHWPPGYWNWSTLGLVWVWDENQVST